MEEYRKVDKTLVEMARLYSAQVNPQVYYDLNKRKNGGNFLDGEDGISKDRNWLFRVLEWIIG